MAAKGLHSNTFRMVKDQSGHFRPSDVPLLFHVSAEHLGLNAWESLMRTHQTSPVHLSFSGIALLPRGEHGEYINETGPVCLHCPPEDNQRSRRFACVRLERS